MYGIWSLYENELDAKYAEHNVFTSFDDTKMPVQQFQEDLFWRNAEGDRVIGPGVQLPRTSIDDVFRNPSYRDRYNTFNID